MPISINFFPLPAFLGLILLVIFLIAQRRNGAPDRRWAYIASLGLFGLYLLAVISVVFFPLYITGIDLSWAHLELILTTSVNLIPFNYGTLFKYTTAGLISPNVALEQIGGNILLTIPFGALITWLRYLRGQPVLRSWGLVALVLGPGLAIEGIQFLLMFCLGAGHAIDINDVIQNGTGSLIGYGLVRSGLKLWAARRIHSSV